MLALGGASADPRYPLDGVDLLPLCQGRPVQMDRTLFWRTREEEAAREEAWKYLRTAEGELLFDISNDPGERANLAAYHPEKLARLRNQFHRWNSEMLLRPTPAVRR